MMISSFGAAGGGVDADVDADVKLGFLFLCLGCSDTN